MSQHTQNILQHSTASLHYFVLWMGNGHRSTSFIRLWEFPESTPADEWYQVQANILEAVFCRAFRSHHGMLDHPDTGQATATRYFGLNVMSPLVQGYGLDTYLRTKANAGPARSPDCQIRHWAVFNPKQKKGVSDRSRRPIFQRDFCGAVRRALGEKAEPVLDYLQLDLEILDDTRLANTPPYVGNVKAPLGFVLDYEKVSAAQDTPLEPTDSQIKQLVLPWSLRKCLFTDNNVIAWTYNFRAHTQLNPGDLAMLARNKRSSHGNSHRAMLDQIHARIIFLCGPRAEKAIREALRCPIRYTLELSGFEYPVYLDDAAEFDKRLYIRIPELPAEIWSNEPKHSVKLAEALRFGINILGLKNLRPYFFESSSVMWFILGQARRERLGELPMTVETVDEGIKLWLARKGLGEKEDLEKIEYLGGSLSRGLLMVLHALSRREKDGTKVPQARLPSSGSESKVRCHENFDVRRYSALTEFVNDKVKERERKYTDLIANLPQGHPGIPSTLNPIPTVEREASPGLPKYEVVDEDNTSDGHDLFDNEAAVALTSFSLLGEREATAVGEIGSLLLDRQTSAHHSVWKGLERLGLKKRLVNESALEPEIADLTSLVDSIGDRELMDLDKAPPSDPMATDYMRRRRQTAGRGSEARRRINPNSGVRNWLDEASLFRDKVYEYTFNDNTRGNNRQIRIGHCPIYLDRHVDIGDGRFWIRIEIYDDEKRHPSVYATSSTEQDPGKRLAFLVKYYDSTGLEQSFYPQQNGTCALYRANSLVDILLYRKSALEILETPRRFLSKRGGGVYTSHR
ncbi:hypothetical protein ASPCAL05818 [Aspergillus calidoustus]|uniref:Uncharacterized protein n=1 Tax=Aspergillus calidoustus TaxID=454130 RepID=A0A0U5GUV3_ASPCI|nr:hypothetical protein ASPCAL05818 [Aspergillus calidoustus]